ncbi:MAG: hypothetical protein ACI4NG_06580 [Candidatus Gallimonas sp.]
MRALMQSTTAYKSVSLSRARGEAAHATLVVFPDGKYLRMLLRECARAFFGAERESRTGDLIAAERYSDCLFFPAEGGKLTADDVSRMIDESLLRPVEGGEKLFVLDAFQNASPTVQNKLLKLLEEPPAGVYFLIGATTDFPVLPTVLSRVRRLEEQPFCDRAIEEALSRNYPDKTEARACAAASGGIYSAAEELLLGGGGFRLAEEYLLGADTERLCRELGEGKETEKRAFFPAVRLLLRDALFLRTGGGAYQARGGAAVRRLAERPTGALLAALDGVTEAEKQLKFNANFGQCAETLAIRMREELKKWQKLS